MKPSQRPHFNKKKYIDHNQIYQFQKIYLNSIVLTLDYFALSSRLESYPHAHDDQLKQNIYKSEMELNNNHSELSNHTLNSFQTTCIVRGEAP